MSVDYNSSHSFSFEVYGKFFRDVEKIEAELAIPSVVFFLKCDV
jgi:hypothetical protein